jgi:hypothetical protein
MAKAYGINLLTNKLTSRIDFYHIQTFFSIPPILSIFIYHKIVSHPLFSKIKELIKLI